MRDFIPREKLAENFAKNFRIETEKPDWIDGSKCPNCYRGKLQATPAVKSEYQSRYHYLLICPLCRFRYLKKFAVTGSGRIRDTGFTDDEFKKATNRLVLGR